MNTHPLQIDSSKTFYHESFKQELCPRQSYAISFALISRKLPSLNPLQPVN